MIKINLKIENRKKMIALSKSDVFNDWETEIEVFAALNFCRNWSRYRKWILSHGRSLTDFDQELKFRQIIKIY